MSKVKMIPMRMVYMSVEVITFHDDIESMAEKIAKALPGSYVRIYENETAGNELVRREEVRVIRPGDVV